MSHPHDGSSARSAGAGWGVRRGRGGSGRDGGRDRQLLAAGVLPRVDVRDLP